MQPSALVSPASVNNADRLPVTVLDNVPFHKSATTQTLIPHTGTSVLFLPPYSPELNPIEHDFATLKKHREYNEHETLDHPIV
jgi:transposase